MDWKEKFFHPAGKVENVKPKHSETPVKRTVRYAEMYKSQRLRGNQRNWNGQKSNQLGCHFVLNNKACFICGCFDHLQYNCPNQQRKRMSGLKSFNTARPVNTVRSVNNTRPFSTTRPRAVNTARQFCKTLSWQIAEWLKNYVLFTDTECLVLSPDFKLPDENPDNFLGILEKEILGLHAKWCSERKNRTSLRLLEPLLADSKLPTLLGREVSMLASTNRVLIIKPHNKTPYELFRVKLLGVYNTRTKKVQENLHIGFLENKPYDRWEMVHKWCFDIDSQTHSMNYKDALYFDLHSQNTGDAEPRSATDNQIKDKDGSHDENDDTDTSNDDSSLKDDGTADQQVNTASPEVNTGSREVSTAFPEVNTATPEDLVGPSHSSEDIQVESFNNQDDQEVDLGNIPNSYAVPTTPKQEFTKITQLNIDWLAYIVSITLDLMIGSLMYLTVSRPDIMFAVCACARFQVSPKTSHLLAVKRIFRYLKSKPTLGLWFLRKQTVVATSTTEADYCGCLHVAVDLVLLDTKLTAGLGIFLQMVLMIGRFSVLGLKYWNAKSLMPKSLVFVKCHIDPILAEVYCIKQTEEGTQAITAMLISEGISSLPIEEILFEHDKTGVLQSTSDKTYILFKVSSLFYWKFFILTYSPLLSSKKNACSLLQHTRTYPTPTLTNKLFNNMRRPTKGYPRVITPLFATMLLQPQGESSTTYPSNISSSPYQSSEPSPSPTEPQQSQPLPSAEELLHHQEITYSRRSAARRKDKGKAIMIEPEAKKKSKKELEQERLSLAEAIRLQEQVDEEQRAQIARDEEIARQWRTRKTKELWEYTSKKSTGKRKKSLPKKRTKKQKVELDDEKEELKDYLDIVPREDVAVDIDSLSTKYPIVDWKAYILSKTFIYYKIFRGDGSSKNYKILSKMLEDFDRQDVVDLYRLVKERYSSSKPEGYDLMLWGDLYTLFEPDEESEIMGKIQHEYN
ncbi:hypothetical protein Tco_0926691 [Tanacetum coccineum]|uniref:Uncharacterized protein n=1 Tax=Tanacetum coccineum TaxID=301880 RepID=A0ABQ5DD62_9ASTR